MKEIAIDVHGLTKSFGARTVVHDLSLQVPKGEIYGFLGPNGSGKTTTLRMLCGLLTPDAGEGTCLGYDIRTQSDAIKRNVGYMTQRFSLYADLSIRENLEFVARVYGVPNPRQAAREAIGGSGFRPAPTSLPANCRAVGSSGWRSAPASCRSPSCCCSMSRPPASIPRRGASSGTRSITSPPRASPCWSPPITWTRPSAVTRSPISPMASCWRKAPHARWSRSRSSSTWIVSGKDLHRLATKLETCDGVDMVAPFGAELHVSGRDKRALDDAIAAAKKSDGAHHWTRGEPSLEDVFILLMDKAKDNYA